MNLSIESYKLLPQETLARYQNVIQLTNLRVQAPLIEVTRITTTDGLLHYLEKRDLQKLLKTCQHILRCGTIPQTILMYLEKLHYWITLSITKSTLNLEDELLYLITISAIISSLDSILTVQLLMVVILIKIR